MALTQIQTIQSLGEAMNWLERELSWGVKPKDITHLSGRIGELYAALITNGQMALNTNQKGYDVISSNGERISVKTYSKTTASVSFNPNTLELVDRIMIFHINTEEMQIETLLDATTDEARKLFGENNTKISLSKLIKEPKDLSSIPVVRTATYKEYEIIELENGTIQVFQSDENITPAKPILRDIASELNISILNAAGNPHNTRQLGSLIIKTIQRNAT